MEYIKTSLDEDGSGLISSHYIEEVLPQTKQFKEFHCKRLTDWVDGVGQKPLKDVFDESRELNERQTEDVLIRPILESLDNKLLAQVGLDGDIMDFVIYDGDEYLPNHANTTAVIESKRYGRIEGKYFIRKEDNTDEIYQTLNYLRTLNLMLNNTGSDNDVNYIVLTDGYTWRIYSKLYTHSVKEYERHFIEFDLEAISKCPDKAERDKYLKLFGIFLCKQSLAGQLLKHERDSSELERAVTTELREQTFTALEYIATGLWRKLYVEQSPILSAVVKSTYGLDVEEAHIDERIRADLLRIVYDESLVFLLRLLFVLYAEDRNLFDQNVIPKVIKGENNLLDLIVQHSEEIGSIDLESEFLRNDDLKLANTFKLIDAKYNGGLFSSKKHPLLYDLDMDDILFSRAIDNLCRVQVKKRIYTVDFSTISERELGGIYESLLEYKMAMSDRDVAEMPSIVNKKRIRRDVRTGDLFLINHKGERKATGSYYTPDLIVEHLVETGLVPQLREVRESHSGSFEELFDAVLDIKVCDPAMGSGHMLIACYNRMVEFVRQCLEELHEDGKTKRIWDKETAYMVHTQVARKCIYGVDLNPTAVELAKLVLWMKVFRPDKPFEFFDYNLACGNSLIGVYDEVEASGDEFQMALFRSQEQVEKDIQADLLRNVSRMLDMPRDTVEEVHAVDDFWRKEVRPLQRQVAFLYNVKLAKWLLPDKMDIVNAGYEQLVEGIDADRDYVKKILIGDSEIPESVLALKGIDNEIRNDYRPLHWRIAFPHVAVRGGFDFVISNPPWDKVKPYREEYFSDLIEGYAYMETKDAKAASDALMADRPEIAEGWKRYEENFTKQNRFYQDSYEWQVVKDKDGKALKGDNNLYKVFIEKIYTILKDKGICGLVVPDNLNIDAGCTGLRRLLLERCTICELVMFENRKRLFDIHGQYKFDVITFEKAKPRKNLAFKAGFYWYDPIWLDGNPDADYIALSDYNKREHHRMYHYSTDFIRTASPDTLTIFEFRNKRQMDVFKKMMQYPPIGDERLQFHIRTYAEFHMTNDSDLFNTTGIGWPLYQGGMVHHYNAHLKQPERFVVQGEGEDRLASKWKKDRKQLPDRTYRIGWRDIAQPTDTRSLICSVIPRAAFVGNTLNLIEVQGDLVNDYEIVAALDAILSSTVPDFYVRQRMAKHVSAFILKELPLPRDLEAIRGIGKMALPLFEGEDFDAFRGGTAAISHEDARNKLIAKIDARVAHLYGLTYEEYQSVLDSFPLVDAEQKKRCLNAFNDWTFEL